MDADAYAGNRTDVSLNPIEIAKGYLQASPDDAQQHFTIWQVALDAVEVRFSASRAKRLLRVDQIAGHEVKLAIEKALGAGVTIDYAASVLTFGGMRSPPRMAPLFPRRR